MRKLALFGHQPSQSALEYVTGLGDDWAAYKYHLHTEQMQGIYGAVLACVMTIHEAIDLERVNRILLAPPGLSVAVPLMVEALRGISGVRPEILVLINSPEGYTVCPERPIVDPAQMYRALRQRRRPGPVNHARTERPCYPGAVTAVAGSL